MFRKTAFSILMIFAFLSLTDVSHAAMGQHLLTSDEPEPVSEKPKDSEEAGSQKSKKTEPVKKEPKKKEETVSKKHVEAGSDQAKNEESSKKAKSVDEPSKSPDKVKQTIVRSSSKSDGKKDKRDTRVRGNAPCLAWVDDSAEVKAAIVCVHGLGLHNGTYEAFGKRMSALGYATYAIDVRGFGSWADAKGRETCDFDHCLDDVKATLKVVRRSHPKTPVFLLGESMGGAIALRATSLYPEMIDGLISSVPSGDRFKQGKTKMKVAFGFLSNPNKPMTGVGEKVVHQATENEELRKAWLEDPLTRLNLSPRELIQFQNFMNGNHDSAKQITKTPVLIVQGCNDKLVRPEGTVELYNRLATPDREIVLIPNAEHLIFEESQFNDQVIATVTAWMDARIAKIAQEKNVPHVEDKAGEKADATKGNLQ